MKKRRTKLYVKANEKEHCAVCSGIAFSEFIQYLDQPLDNLLLIKGDYPGNAQAHNFELLEGRDEIRKLAQEGIDPFGDFCFLDYEEPGAPAQLDGQQVAEILFLAHMGEPLQSPFFAPLGNRFAYLAHDDGWNCRLYCRDMRELMAVIEKKLTGKNQTLPSDLMQAELLKIAQNGLLIDLEEKQTADLQVYTVGELYDMDAVLNNWNEIKSRVERVTIPRRR